MAIVNVISSDKENFIHFTDAVQSPHNLQLAPDRPEEAENPGTNETPLVCVCLCADCGFVGELDIKQLATFPTVR